MPRKDKMTNRERELAAFTHCERYLVHFHQTYQRPRRQLPLLAEAIKEIGQLRLTLQAEYDKLVLGKVHGNIKQQGA